jgi:hypothetical protein
MTSRPIWRGPLRLALVSCRIARSERSSIQATGRIKMVTNDSEESPGGPFAQHSKISLTHKLPWATQRPTSLQTHGGPHGAAPQHDDSRTRRPARHARRFAASRRRRAATGPASRRSARHGYSTKLSATRARASLNAPIWRSRSQDSRPGFRWASPSSPRHCCRPACRGSRGNTADDSRAKGQRPLGPGV